MLLMGFNKCHLPKVENLQKEFDNVGLELFIKRYRKCDCITGPSESFIFLEEKKKEYHLEYEIEKPIKS
jgi:hypothetical protein